MASPWTRSLLLRALYQNLLSVLSNGSRGRSCWNSFRELDSEKTVIAVNHRDLHKADNNRQNNNQLPPLKRPKPLWPPLKNSRSVQGAAKRWVICWKQIDWQTYQGGITSIRVLLLRAWYQNSRLVLSSHSISTTKGTKNTKNTKSGQSLLSFVHFATFVVKHN